MDVVVSDCGLKLDLGIPRARLIAPDNGLEVGVTMKDDPLSKILNATPDTVIISRSDDGLISYVNPAFIKTFGYSAEEVLGKTVLELNFWRNPENRPSLIKEIERNGTVSENEIEYRAKGGHAIPMSMSFSIIEMDGEKFVVSIGRDITERKQAEDALRKSEFILTEAQRLANIGSWEWDVEEGVITWSDELFRIMGIDPQSITLHYDSVFDYVHPEDVAAIKDALADTVERHDIFYMEYRIIRPSGEIRTVHGQAEVNVGEHDVVRRIMGTVQDITERKQVEVALRSSEERFRALYDNNPIMLYAVDEYGVIVSVNQFALDQLGYSKDELVSKPAVSITFDEDRTAAEEYLRQCFETPGSTRNWELRKTCQNGSVIYMRETARVVNDIDGRPVALIVCEDITETRRLAEKITYQATHDALTGLVNRREFERHLKQLFDSIGRDQSEHAMCYIDLDQFKVVNDTCGHAAGDEMLRQISAVLRQGIRKRDTVARLGGDEFGVLMEHCTVDQAHRAVSSMQEAVQNFQFNWEDRVFRVGVSIGLVEITSETPTIQELLRRADAACYMAKDLGRNRVHVYCPEDIELARRHGEMQWVTRVQRALDEDRFCLFAQAIMPVEGCDHIHYELLIRLDEGDGQLIPPGAFLPAAERYSVITQLDTWVVTKALDVLISNPGFLTQISCISINLSGQSLSNLEFLDFIVTELDKSGIAGAKICFEITETAAIANLSTATTFIATLKEYGCRFALDDFGSGLSSFAYLKTLPVDYLKIDGAFVKDIVDDPIHRAMVKSINEIGHVMGMKTIAEFVENDEIMDVLRVIGVDYAQGYGIGRPQSFEALVKHEIADLTAVM